MQIAAKTQKVLAGPMVLFKVGNVNVRIKQAIQSADTATEIATPRMRFGKISEISTHVMGASDIP